MSRFLLIKDEHSKIFGYRILNSQLTLYLGLVQLVICFWSLAQHLYSMIALKKVLHCDFSANSTLPSLLTAVDVIIFDVGLFHSLWGIDGCVAEHLDGGYGRFAWCISHSASLIFCLPFAFVRRPKPHHLWPLLIQQSAYGIGLLILSLAALPRVLPTFMGDLSNAPLHALLVYAIGALLNFFLLYILYHWYWHVEEWWNSARKVGTDQLQRSHNRRTGQPIAPTPNNFDFAPLISRQKREICATPIDNSFGELSRSGEIAEKEGHQSVCSTFTPPAEAASRICPLSNGEINKGELIRPVDAESASTLSAAEQDADIARRPPARFQPGSECNQGRKASPTYLEVPPMFSPILKTTRKEEKRDTGRQYHVTRLRTSNAQNLDSQSTEADAAFIRHRKASITSGSLAGNNSVLSYETGAYPVSVRAEFRTPSAAVAPTRRRCNAYDARQRSSARPARRIHHAGEIDTRQQRFFPHSGDNYGYRHEYSPISIPSIVGRRPVGYVVRRPEYFHPPRAFSVQQVAANYYTAGDLRPSSRHTPVSKMRANYTVHRPHLAFQPVQPGTCHIHNMPQEDYYRLCPNYAIGSPSRFL